MSFNKIESALIAEAEAAGKKIIEDAVRQKDSILNAANEKNERAYEEAVRQAELSSSRETTRQVGLARHEGKLKLLAAKNKMIDTVFTLAAERIKSLSEKEYMNLMENWLETIPADSGGRLIVGTDDVKRFSDDFLAKINSKRAGDGKIESVETDPQIQGGFIVIGENFTINSTVESKINHLRESIAGDLAREIFDQ